MIKRKLLFPPIHFIGGGSIDDENKELMYKITNIIKKVKSQQDKYPIIKQIDEYLGLVIKEGKIYLKNKTINDVKKVPIDDVKKAPIDDVKIAPINDVKIVVNGDIIKEETDDNFGHTDLIWEGDVKFPPAKKINQNSRNYNYNNYSNNSGISGGSGYSYVNNQSKSLPQSSVPFDKQAEISRALQSNNLNPVENQKKYFKLFRYGYKKLNKPNDSNGPTLSISLFMPNSILHKVNSEGKLDFSRWTQKYFQNQLKLCVVFNYYFPNGNYRNYFDYYMLKKFESLSGDDDSLKVTKQIKQFVYNDFEEEQGMKVKLILNQFYNEIKKYEDFKFNNGLERFIFSFDLACRCYNNNGKIEIREKTGDFFVYKLGGPYLENQGQTNEGHKTNGFIGQHMRYISLKQSNYNYNGSNINRPILVLTRDAHATNIGFNDSKLINELFSTNMKKVYLLGHSYYYEILNHDIIKCKNTEFYKHKSFWAGYTNFLNSTNDDKILKDSEYLKTIGLPFILNENKIVILNHRHITKNAEFYYGIDEYILSNFIINKESRKKLILMPFNFIYPYFDKLKTLKPILKPVIIYLIEKKILSKNKKYSIAQLFNEIEKLRESKIKNNKLGLVLSYIPTKYTSLNLTTVNTENYLLFKENIDLNVDDSVKFDDINLSDYGIECNKNILLNTMVECNNPYLKTNIKIDDKCLPADFYSGFYNEKPPSLDIGILRQPSDLKYAIEALEKNKLKIPLNKSNYKLKVESDKLKNAVSNSVDNMESGHIKATIQNIILSFGRKNILTQLLKAQEIASSVSLLNPDGIAKTQSKVWVPLIWKALNYSGYDVPPEWIKVDLGNDNEKYRQFNEYVKELSNLSGWTEYAMHVLLNAGNEQFKEYDNTFESEKVIKLSTQYNKSYKNINFKQYKMATYNSTGGSANTYKTKYLKYKNKYLKLKNKLNK